eukprot:COSAG06_NODE_1492_length_9279_cov_835.540632_9_plen_102_part_00
MRIASSRRYCSLNIEQYRTGAIIANTRSGQQQKTTRKPTSFDHEQVLLRAADALSSDGDNDAPALIMSLIGLSRTCLGKSFSFCRITQLPLLGLDWQFVTR